MKMINLKNFIPQNNKKLRQISFRRSLKSSMKICMYPKKHPRNVLLNRKLIKMICVDMQPFSIVDDNGFIKFVNALDPKYQLPCGRTVTDTLLPLLFNECNKALNEVLKDVR